jgi:predicted Zn finger-like uncharacterized protein
MVTACTQCSARYSIPDDKIRGLRGRVKCKRCGAPILVDGTGLGPAGSAGPGSSSASAKAPTHPMVRVKPKALPRGPVRHVPSVARTRVGGLLAPAVETEHWHVALDGGTPEFPVAALAEKCRHAEIDADTFVWRDGMPDWVDAYGWCSPQRGTTTRA